MRLRVAAVVLLAGLSWACAEQKADIRDVRITEANRAALSERVNGGTELTGEEVRLLDRYRERKGLDQQLPVGLTIGEMLAEQRGFEASGAPPVADAGEVPEEPAGAMEVPPASAAPAAQARAERDEAEERAPSPPAAPSRPAPPAPPSGAGIPAPPSVPAIPAPPSIPAPPEPAVAPTPPPPPPAPATPRPRRNLEVPAGTAIEAYLDEPLGSKTSASGDAFAAVLARDLVVKGQVVAPKGSHLVGRVVEARPSGKVKGVARLSVTLEGLELGRRSHSLKTSTIVIEANPTKGQDAKKVGIGAGAGTVIGAILGGKKGAAIGGAVGAATGGAVVLATAGDEVELPAEQLLAFELESDLRLPNPER